MKKSEMCVAFFSFILLSMLASAQTGVASFSSQVNWSQTPQLYFNVNGGPPNMCGDLVTTRNGQLLVAHGWICTDANGNAQNGPWTWSQTPGDQTDTGVHINWANGATTNANSNHIWDKTCPAIQLDSTTGRPPMSFKGSGIDGNWGAGFGSWTFVAIDFYDATWGSSYDQSTGSYSSPFPSGINATLTGLGTLNFARYNLGWSSPVIPPTAAHISGHQYRWVAILGDGDNRCQSRTEYDFTF